MIEQAPVIRAARRGDPGVVARDRGRRWTRVHRYQRDGRAWVTADASDTPVGYVLADLVDGNGHVEQVSAHPDWTGRRCRPACGDASSHRLTAASRLDSSGPAMA
ncbi:MAG: hypothetical protein ACRDO7_11285 [Nocardioidaceae bacterium]